MDKPISVGDMVQLVRGCNIDAMGLVFRVSKIYERAGVRPCYYCDQSHNGQYVDSEQPFGGAHNYSRSPIWWLKRIPPLEELEGEKREETVNA